MEDAAEYLLSLDPLVVRRRVLWGECDPAGVVYTPRFGDYAVSARDYWFRHVLGHSDRPHPARKQITFPMRALQFEFRGMIAADDSFDMQVSLEKIGNSSFTLGIDARRADGARVFTASLTQVAFDQAKGGAIPIPDHLLQRLEEIVQMTG